MDNPINRRYAPSAPIPDPNCIGCGGGFKGFFFPPLVSGGGGSGKATEVLPGYSIAVDDESDSDTYRFKVGYSPDIALSAAMTIIAKAAGVSKANPVLIGTQIDEIVPSWSYNKAVASQSLSAVVSSPDSPISFPGISAVLRTADVTSILITRNCVVSIHGDDGLGNPNSTANASTSIQFGNYVAWGDDVDHIGLATTTLQTLLSALSKQIQTNRVHTLTTTGGANRYFFYFVPARFGEVTFTKGIFVGGYRRLHSVSGVLKAILDFGDTDVPITLVNGAGYTEEYYVYQSLYDNKADSVTPTYAT
jgi:hypothetical protein